jgi:hypothetical protein
MDTSLSRRGFNYAVMKGLMTYAFLETVFEKHAFAEPVKPITDHWSKRLNELSLDMKGGKISQVQWQDMTSELFSHVELEELCRFIDFEKVKANFAYPEEGPRQVHVKFPEVEGLPTEIIYQRKVFGLKKGRAIIPHSHINMCSMHMIIQGEFDLKHYDIIHDEGSHLVVRPTIDRIARVGSNSTISEQRDNIHWFRALTDIAHTFDIVVDSLHPELDFSLKLEFLDPLAAEKAGDSALRMAKIPYEEAMRKYGREIHH